MRHLLPVRTKNLGLCYIEDGRAWEIFLLLKKVHKRKSYLSCLWIKLEEDVMADTMAAILPPWGHKLHTHTWERLNRKMKRSQVPTVSLCGWINKNWNLLWSELTNLLLLNHFMLYILLCPAKHILNYDKIFDPLLSTWIL